MDGGSTDNSVEIIRRYDSWLTHWVSEPDRGQSHAINKGLAMGTGQIFTWLNSDDMLIPGALWHVAEAYQKSPNAAAWVGACYLIKPNGRIIKTVVPRGLDRDSLANWFYGGFIFQPSCFFAANAWQEINGVDESLYFAMDFDLWLRLSAIGEFKPMPEILSAAIIHDSAKTQALIPEMHAETMVVQFKYGYRDLAYKRLRELLKATIKDQQKGRKLKARMKRTVRRLRALGNKETPYVQYVQFVSTNPPAYSEKNVETTIGNV
jgi:glycosyltransferase involved in cell wall biosynthesis